MESPTRMFDPDIHNLNPVMETVRPTGLTERVSRWFRSIVEELDDADMTFDPLIDFPRDL